MSSIPPPLAPTLRYTQGRLLLHRSATLVIFTCLFAILAPAQDRGRDTLRAQVAAVENAFAQTMADRDFDAFAIFVSDEAIFFSRQAPLHGRPAVLEYWKKFFESKEPPFSWKADIVEVLTSGTLALSDGPVYDEHGTIIARFSSIWRLDADGRWRIVFDKGYRVCQDERK